MKNKKEIFDENRGDRAFLFERCRDAVSAEDAARKYGVHINEHGKALCPFHNDHNPSMTFRNGRYKCWACNVGGDSIDFTMKLFGLNALDAVRRLNADFCLALPIDRPPSRKETAEAEKRKHLADTQRRYEEWRKSMLNDLNKAFRIAHIALNTKRELTEQEAIAVYWMSPIEEWADALESAEMSKQMSVFRVREEVGRICAKILKSTRPKSTAA